MRNRIIVTRERLESELYQLEYLIAHFNIKQFPNGDGITQFTAWLKKRKDIRAKLSALPTVRDIQSRAKRANISNSYSAEHVKLLAKMNELLASDIAAAKKSAEW